MVSEGQKAFLRPDRFWRETKPAICITEPEAGSAATEMQTTARKQGRKYILNGTKHWITGGGISKLHLVFARVFDENNNELGIGGFIVHRDPDRDIHPTGLEIRRRETYDGSLRDAGSRTSF